MRRLLLATILSTSCFNLAACGEPERVASSVRPDLDNPDWLVCEGAPAERPERGDPLVIDWSTVTSVEGAKALFDRYVAVERQRNGVVANYVVEIEGRLFTCANNAQRWRDYWDGMPDPAPD